MDSNFQYASTVRWHRARIRGWASNWSSRSGVGRPGKTAPTANSAPESSRTTRSAAADPDVANRTLRLGPLRVAQRILLQHARSSTSRTLLLVETDVVRGQLVEPIREIEQLLLDSAIRACRANSLILCA